MVGVTWFKWFRTSHAQAVVVWLMEGEGGVGGGREVLVLGVRLIGQTAVGAAGLQAVGLVV